MMRLPLLTVPLLEQTLLRIQHPLVQLLALVLETVLVIGSEASLLVQIA